MSRCQASRRSVTEGLVRIRHSVSQRPVNRHSVTERPVGRRPVIACPLSRRLGERGMKGGSEGLGGLRSNKLHLLGVPHASMLGVNSSVSRCNRPVCLPSCQDSHVHSTSGVRGTGGVRTQPLTTSRQARMIRSRRRSVRPPPSRPMAVRPVLPSSGRRRPAFGEAWAPMAATPRAPRRLH